MAYYIVKSVLLYDYDKFLFWCEKYNISLVKFDKSQLNLRRFGSYFEDKYKNKGLLKSILDMEIKYSKLRGEYKNPNNYPNWLEKYNSHSALLYTEAVAMETMRIKPVAPLIYNQALEDVEIKGYLFKKDSKLLIESRYAGMQDENFSNAKEFKPERWIKQEKGKCPMGHDTKAYIPFGAGARFCPGKNLAMLEMKLVLSMLMRNFKVELITPANEVKEVMAFTMMPSEYQVKLIKRD